VKFLWRKNTQIKDLSKTNKSFEGFVYPSGRQAIMHTLRNMHREDRLAVAEYSSQCVFNAVASYTTPIPTKEAVENNIFVNAIMVYEQWGWSFSDNIIDEVLDKYNKVIFDCVDSPNAHIKYKDMDSVVVSLSKCLGLKGGAILLENKVLQKNMCTSNELLGLDVDNPDCIHMINSYINTISHIGDLSKVDMLLELNKEAKIRNINLKLFTNSSLSNNWSHWMFDSINNCSAGIVPLFKGVEVNRMRVINNKIKQKLNIESVIYNFNWSGSPLVFDYQPCIAFPIHSGIDSIKESIKMLENVKI
jgi:hypothetical protein